MLTELNQNIINQQELEALVERKVASEEIIDRIHDIWPGIKFNKLVEQIKKRDIEIIRLILQDLNLTKISLANQEKAMWEAIQSQKIDIINQMIEKGFQIPECTTIKAIWLGDADLLDFIFNNRLFNKEETSILDYWFLLYSQYFKQGKILYQQGTVLSRFLQQHDLSPEDQDVVVGPILLQKAMLQALSLNQDQLACLILNIDLKILNRQAIELALENICIEFLKTIWTGEFKIHDKKPEQKVSLLLQGFSLKDDRQWVKDQMSIHHILEKLIQKENNELIDEVLNWPNAADDKWLVQFLIEKQLPNFAIIALKKSRTGPSAKDYLKALEYQYFELAMHIMQYPEAHIALDNIKVQKQLIDLLESGQNCIFAIQMLYFIQNHQWKQELTKLLCKNLDSMIRRTNQMIACQSPILYCALAAEFLIKISEFNLQYQSICIHTAQQYIQVGIDIERCLKSELQLNFYLQQKDLQGRTALSIISHNRFYQMLENKEIGAIVRKLWDGQTRFFNLYESSSLYRSFVSSYKSYDSIQFVTGLQSNQPYIFHYESWIHSCSLRFIAQASSTIVLLLIYNLMIYISIQSNSFEDISQDQDALLLLRIASIWIISIIVEHFLYFLYCQKTGRLFMIDFWKILDICMFSMMIVIIGDLNEEFVGNGKVFENIDAAFFNASLHSIQVVIIWIRLLSVLIVSRQLGSFIRMMFLMLRQILNFLVIFLSLLISSAAVFNSFFYTSSDQYKDFTTSLQSLFAAALANQDFGVFDKNEELGSVMLSVFILISNILLLNLLIALLTSIYSEIIQKVDSENRAVVIYYYEKFSWDDQYGFLIFLPPPWNYITLVFSPIILLKRNIESINTLICRVSYILYAVPQFVIYLCIEFIMIIPLYIKGFYIYKFNKLKTQTVDQEPQEEQMTLLPSISDRDTHAYKNRKMLGWVFIGIPLILQGILKDIYFYWKELYQQTDEQIEVSDSLNEIIDQKFIENLNESAAQIIVPKIHLKDFIQVFIAFDHLTHEITPQRKILIKQSLTQFVLDKRGFIDMNLLRLLILNNKDEDQIKHINVPAMTKAIQKYQKNFGCIVIHGIQIPKQIGIGGGQLDSYFLENVKDISKVLNRKIEEIEELSNYYQSILR